MKPWFVCLLFGLLILPAPSAHSQALLLTFDDLSETGSGSYLNSYHGLGWENFACINAILNTNLFGPVVIGSYYGMVSPSNVVINGIDAPAEVDATGTTFNFLSAYLTGAFNSNLNIRVQGFVGTNLVYDETKVVEATYPTLCTFDYLDVDRLVFSSSGGQPAFGVTGGYSDFVMDNFMFEFIPEPSTFLLAALATVSLAAFLGHRRRDHAPSRPKSG
jgi:hypothetical protein